MHDLRERCKELFIRIAQEDTMTRAEVHKLETIIGKIESLQSVTKDREAASRLMTAKNELLRLLSEKS